MTAQRKKNCWTPGMLAGLAVVVVTFIPQLSLCIKRGVDWNGAYAFTDSDELAYSAYLNSLIQGKPRRNNPEVPIVNPQDQPKFEDLFSIQFVPPYLVAFVARFFGLSASTTFILLTPLMAFASSMALFWLLTNLTGDAQRAALGVLLILLCGLLVSSNLLVTNNPYAVFSFLRRYIPSVAFPLVFVFCVMVWRAYTQPSKASFAYMFGAGIVFDLLIYSYFYLWTAVGAWFVCFTIIWFIARPHDRTNLIKCSALFAVLMIPALILYLNLLADRAPNTDSSYGLLLTHAPDLFRSTEILGAAIIAVLVFYVRKGKLSWESPIVIFASSCAVVPFVAFNQQVISGRLLQPFHFEQFIVNYLILISAVLIDHLLWKVLQRRPVFSAALAVVIGLTLAVKTTRVYFQANIQRDEAVPLFEKLEAEASQRPSTGAALFDKTILSASSQTTCSSLPVFWSLFTYAYGTDSENEEQERLFQYLYYLGVDGKTLEQRLNTSLIFRGAIFGLPRVNRTLAERFEPISDEEIRIQVDAYSTYINGFSRQQAERRPLSYVILIKDQQYDLSNLDRWYERDSGEVIGRSVVYRVRLRSAADDKL